MRGREQVITGRDVCLCLMKSYDGKLSSWFPVPFLQLFCIMGCF